MAANTNAIGNIELFSTGGLLTNALNQPAVVFSVAGTNLRLPTVSHGHQMDPAGRRGLALPGFARGSAGDADLARRGPPQL